MRTFAMLLSLSLLSPLIASQALAGKPSSQAASAASSSASAAKAKASTTQSAKAEELTPAEKDLLAQGYRMRIVDGQRRFCRREAVLGSNLERTVCTTPAQVSEARETGREITEQIQRNQLNPSGH